MSTYLWSGPVLELISFCKSENDSIWREEEAYLLKCTDLGKRIASPRGDLGVDGIYLGLFRNAECIESTQDHVVEAICSFAQGGFGKRLVAVGSKAEDSKEGLCLDGSEHWVL